MTNTIQYNRMKLYRVFLDDRRSVKMVYPRMDDSDFYVVRSFHDFVSLVEEKGVPEFISFDNDLGEDEDNQLLPDGYAIVKWMVYEKELDLSNLEYNIHSANPVARIQIKSLLDNYISFLKENKETR